MFIIHVIIIYLLYIIITEAYNTQVCHKKDIDLAHEPQVIDTTRDSFFLNFIKSSSIWADKSLLVRDCMLYNSTYVLLDTPPKWGRTTILSMLKLFYELPMDKNGNIIPLPLTAGYRYFQKGEIVLKDGRVQKVEPLPLISHDPITIGAFLGQFPSIYLNMTKRTNQSDFNDFKTIISEVYQQFKFLTKIWDDVLANPDSTDREKDIAQDNRDTFFRYINKEENDEYVMSCSISYLASDLQTYFQTERGVMLFVDNFEDYFNDICFIQADFLLQKSKKFITFMKSFYNETMNSTSIFKVFLTGIFPVESFLLPMPKGIEFSIIDRHLRHYLGFGSEEVVEMMNLRGIEDSVQDEAIQWYGGYEGVHNTTLLFCPFSVANFINTKKISTYWMDFMCEKYIAPYMKYDVFVAYIADLLRGISGKCNLGNHNFDGIYRGFVKAYYTGGECKPSTQLPRLNLTQDLHTPHHVGIRYFRHMLIEYLLWLGFVTVVPNLPPDSYVRKQYFNVTVPNMEVRRKLNETIDKRIRLPLYILPVTGGLF